MELWEKIKAAKADAEAKYHKDSHTASWEERDMHIFGQMVAAATGNWEPPAEDEPATDTSGEAGGDPNVYTSGPTLKGE